MRPDRFRTGRLRGPGGAIKLDEVTLADSLSLSAKILDSLESGEYTVSWRAAPHDDHPVRGRYGFTIESSSDLR
jgi:methionine-rich copper-binding protein CopC